MTADTYQAKAIQVIRNLMNLLPDTNNTDDVTFAYCWHELSDDAQTKVVEVRIAGEHFIDEIID